MRTLTVEQWRVLTFIQRYIWRWQTFPHAMAIRTGCGLTSKRATQDILRALENDGLIQGKYCHGRLSGSSTWRYSVLPGQTVGVIP